MTGQGGPPLGPTRDAPAAELRGKLKRRGQRIQKLRRLGSSVLSVHPTDPSLWGEPRPEPRRGHDARCTRGAWTGRPVQRPRRPGPGTARAPTAGRLLVTGAAAVASPHSAEGDCRDVFN